MNWVQLHHRQTPINLHHIAWFIKIAEEGRPYIQFISSSGAKLAWRYDSQTIRDKDYQTLIEMVLNRRTSGHD